VSKGTIPDPDSNRVLTAEVTWFLGLACFLFSEERNAYIWVRV